MRVLVTGAGSGLGLFLQRELGADGLTRGDPFPLAREDRPAWDVIVHCASNSSKEVTSRDLYGYVRDNILLTRELLSVPCGKFIFLSSIDAYPKDTRMHREDEIIPLEQVEGLYAITKLMSESFITREKENHLILRPSSLLGPTMRRNTLVRMITEDSPKLFLSGQSVFNYVTYDSILDFIQLAIDRDLKGIYNIVSSDNITLQKVADSLGKKAVFGKHVYRARKVSNEKLVGLLPSADRSSLDAVKQFMEDQYA